jgi:hypothetical protein
MILNTILPWTYPWHWFSRVFMKEHRIQEILALELPEALSLVCVRNNLVRFPQWPINLVLDMYGDYRLSQLISKTTKAEKCLIPQVQLIFPN